MADNFTQKPQVSKVGLTITEWGKRFITDIHINDKKLVTGTNLIGEVIEFPSAYKCVILEKCQFQREGTSSNYGNSGSNAVTGKPVIITDIRIVFQDIFEKKTSLENPFLLMLCNIELDSNLKTALEAHASHFIALKQGNTKLSEDHIANAYSCALSSSLFHLCSAITMTENQSDERLFFLIDVFYSLFKTTRHTAIALPKVSMILEAVANTPGTRDVFQSMILATLLEKRISMVIMVIQIANAIKRYFKYEGETSSFLEKTPVGLIGVLLIIPLIAEVIISDKSDNPIVDNINHIITMITGCIGQTVSELNRQKTLNRGRLQTDNVNCIFLRSFVSTSASFVITQDIVTDIYTLVKGGENIYKIPYLIGLCEEITSISNEMITIKGNKSNEFVLFSDEIIDEKRKIGILGYDPKDWSGVVFNSLPGDKIVLELSLFSDAEWGQGNTQGESKTANLRFTIGPTYDIITSNHLSISTAGIIFDPSIPNRNSRYQSCSFQEKINPEMLIEIKVYPNRFDIVQNDVVIFSLPKIDGEKLFLTFKFLILSFTHEKNSFQVDETVSVVQEQVQEQEQVQLIARQNLASVFSSLNI